MTNPSPTTPSPGSEVRLILSILDWFVYYGLTSDDLKIAESLTRKLTAFENFGSLLLAKGGYRPSLWTTGRGPSPVCPAHATETAKLADLYDAAQTACGDPRRAFRGY